MSQHNENLVQQLTDELAAQTAYTLRLQQERKDIIQALRDLPISIHITPQEHGGYTYQVLDDNGQRPTFAHAIASAVSYLTGYLAGDRLDALKEKHNNPLDQLN